MLKTWFNTQKTVHFAHTERSYVSIIKTKEEMYFFRGKNCISNYHYDHIVFKHLAALVNYFICSSGSQPFWDRGRVNFFPIRLGSSIIDARVRYKAAARRLRNTELWDYTECDMMSENRKARRKETTGKTKAYVGGQY
jgi:hypothetical protein